MGLFDWLRGRRGFGLDELARRVDVPVAELTSVQATYDTFRIPKRSGGRRTILAPSPELKRLQRRLLRRVLARLRAHPAATGFERGHSFATNAAAHVAQTCIVRLDIRDFFMSTDVQRVERYFRRIGWGRDATRVLLRLCTYDGGLPPGAPTSPRLSNLVNYGLDAALAKTAASLDARYTRYADDMTVSWTGSGDHVGDIINRVSWVCREHGYRIHRRKKLHVRRSHQRQLVTGLVVNNGVNLPRETRRWLRAVEHRRSTRGTPTISDAQLRGWKALQWMILNTPI